MHISFFVIVFSFSLLQFSFPYIFTSLWYCSPYLLASSISLCLSLLQSYLRLVGITSPILVTIIFSFTWSSSTCPDSFASLCRNHRHNYPCLFTSSWSSSLFLFASSTPLHISLSQLSLRLVDITSLKFVTIVFYLSWSSSPCAYHLLILLITLILLVAIVDALILVSSPSYDLLLLISSPCQYQFSYPCRNPLLLFLIVFPFSWFICFSLSRLMARFSSSISSWFFLDFDASVNPSLAPSAAASTASLTLWKKW